MALRDDLSAEVKAIFKEKWETRDGKVVPAPSDLKLSNDAVEFKRATILYADLSGSTALVEAKLWSFAAEIYKVYLHCAAKIIRAEGGSIVSYDGDRVMAIFIGENQTTPAARAALKINYAVQEIINPALKAQYTTSTYQVRQVVGIDTSEIRAARTGVRGDNDIVWVGKAANFAAKLTELDLPERAFVTTEAYSRINDSLKYTTGTPMWKKYTWNQMNDHQIFGSHWIVPA